MESINFHKEVGKIYAASLAPLKILVNKEAIKVLDLNNEN